MSFINISPIQLKWIKRAGWLFATLALVWAIHRDGYDRGASDVQARWDQQAIEQLQAHAQALKTARDKEQTLATQLAHLQRKAAHENTRHAAQLRDLLSQLRQRPERAPEARADTDVARTAAGCTGAQLARPDAHFLARYAADANRLQSALEQCQAAYESARQTLNGETEPK